MVSNNQPKRRVASGLRCQRAVPAGFTLIELLAVIVVILILTGLVIRVAGYVRYQVAVSTTKAQLATITAALEMYKADWGYYPKSNTNRLSSSGIEQGSNNWFLVNSLMPTNTGRKTYMNFPVSQLRINYSTATPGTANFGLPNIYDVWGKPIVYYNSPQTALNNNGGIMSGGQVNPATYDLFSFGPDGYTYAGTVGQGWSNSWTNATSAIDDIMGGSR